MIISPLKKNIMSEKGKEIVRIIVQFITTLVAAVLGINL